MAISNNLESNKHQQMQILMNKWKIIKKHKKFRSDDMIIYTDYRNVTIIHKMCACKLGLILRGQFHYGVKYPKL